MSFKLPFTPLYASQRSGVIALERALWRGQERRFWVQWHEDRAYFQLCDGEPSVWATLDSCAEEDAVLCFEAALQPRRYGVCFQHSTDFYRHSFGMTLNFIYAPDGTGFLREWSSRDWLAFAPQETRMWPLFPDAVLPEERSFRWRVAESYGCCRAAIHRVEHELMMRRVGDEELELLSFRSNSTQAEFEHVARLLWNAGLIQVEEQDKRWGRVSTHTYGLLGEGNFCVSDAHWKGSEALLNWLRIFFKSQGFEWRESGWGKRRFRKLRAKEPHLRAFFEPHPVRWNVSFMGESEPSFHQQLEARLELRKWLRDKVPDQNIESWLAPQT